MKTKKIFFCLLAFCFLVSLNFPAQNLSVKEIMREPSIAGMRVEGEKLSPDGKYVVYLWNADGREPSDLYLVSTSGGAARKISSPKDLENDKAKEEKENKLNYGLVVDDDFAKSQENQIGNLDWSPDSSKILFSQTGDLYVLKIGENKPRRLTNTKDFEGGAKWLDNGRILYSQGGNLFAIDTEKFSLVQISNEADSQKFISVSGATPSKNGELVAYIVSDGSQERALIVPNYMGEFVQTPSFRRGWSEEKIFAAKTDGSLNEPIAIKLPKSEGKSYIDDQKWAADNSSLIVNRIDKTNKRRQLFYIYDVGQKDEKTILVTEETDDKWIAPLSSIIEPNPKNSAQLFFGSESDGFNHLYLATLEKTVAESNPNFTGKVEVKQLSKGNWQVEWAKWSDEKRILFSSTQSSTAEREFYHLFPANGTLTQLTSGRKSFKSNPQMADSGGAITKFIYEASEWNKPGEIFVDASCNVKCEKTTPVKLTETTPESLLKRSWNEPKFIEISSRDDKKIPAKIYLPSDFNKSRKYPMVIFVHGAGYLQNVINGWNNYYREFMFNELLTQKGYVVLDIDYRGSAGYGRIWRTDVYDFLGGKDYEDHLDAIDFMIANYAVDAKKIGVYGGSYGGFMAEMLVMRAPDKIAAAAALRPVADWKNYYASNPVYTSQRLGLPSENAEAYKRSSPISYAEKLEKPLLILHGLVDSNVPVQDSQQLIEKLIRLEKTDYFEAMIYPAENHTFERPTSWTDEYTRILNFFEKHLKN